MHSITAQVGLLHLCHPHVQDLLGRGTLWSKRPLLGYAFGGLRDVGFGVYARVDQIRGSLQERWAGMSPPACTRRELTLIIGILFCLQRILFSAAAAASTSIFWVFSFPCPLCLV